MKAVKTLTLMIILIVLGNSLSLKEHDKRKPVDTKAPALDPQQACIAACYNGICQTCRTTQLPKDCEACSACNTGCLPPK